MFNDLFCSVSGKYYQLDKNQQYLFVANDSDKKIELNTLACQFLQELTTFSTYNEHFENCSGKFGINERQFKNYLNTFYQQGFIKDTQVIVSSLQQVTKNTILEEISGICIRTCDNPFFLKRILDSQVRRKTKFNANERIFVFDDSLCKSAINENKKIVDKSSKIEVYYFGLEWQTNFVNNLINVFPENKEVIQKILLPQEKILFSGGRTMNLALLFFAGKRYLNFDDDFILDDARLHNNHTNDSTIQLGTRPDRVYDGYKSEQVVMQSGVSLDIDPLLLHKQSLGLSLTEFSKSQGNYHLSSRSFSGLFYDDVKRFQPSSDIISTGSGWFGTSGKRDGRFIFSVNYKNILPPWKTAQDFDQLLCGGYCWDSVAQIEMTNHGFSTPAGLNNSQLLAPTISTCKGEDSLLCFMTSILYPNSVHLGFPWALAHFRHPKNWDEHTFNKGKLIQIPELIMSLISNIDLSLSKSTAEKLDLIAATLLKVVSQSESDFRTQLRLLQIKNTTQLIKSLYKQIEKLPDEDLEYQGIIERIISNELSHIDNSTLSKIEDAPEGDEIEQVKWAQLQIENYADGLSLWFKLWHFCKNNPLESYLE